MTNINKSDIEQREKFFKMVRETKKALNYNHDKMAIFFDVPRATYIKWYNKEHYPRLEEKKQKAINKMKKILNK